MKAVYYKLKYNWNQPLLYKTPFSPALWNKTIVSLNALLTIKDSITCTKDSVPCCNLLFKWDTLVKPQQVVRDATIQLWEVLLITFPGASYPFVMQHFRCIQNWMESESRKSTPFQATTAHNTQPHCVPFKNLPVHCPWDLRQTCSAGLCLTKEIIIIKNT